MTEIAVVKSVETIYQDWPDHNAFLRMTWVRVSTIDGYTFFARNSSNQLLVSSQKAQAGEVTFLAEVRTNHPGELANDAGYLQEARVRRKAGLIALEKVQSGPQGGFRSVNPDEVAAIPMSAVEAEMFDRVEKFVITVLDQVESQAAPTQSPRLIEVDY